MSQLKSELAKQLSHLERKVEGICIMIIGMIGKKNATNKLLCDSDYRSENNLRSQQRIRWYTDSAFILIILDQNVKTLPCRNLKIKFSKALVITYQKKIEGLILSCDYKYFPPPIPQKTMLKFAGIVIVPDWTTLIRLGSGNWGDAISWDGLPVG